MRSASHIAGALESVRRSTERLVAPLDDEALCRTATSIMSPPVWDLGHIAAYEELWAWCRLAGGESLHPELQAAYDAFETPREVRTSVRILDPEGARGYLAAARERTLQALHGCRLDDPADPLAHHGFVFDLVAGHEAQHTETILQGLQLMPAGAYVPRREAPAPQSATTPGGIVAIPAGTAELGAGDDDFAYDCERPRHAANVGAFRIARHPVTCGEHLAFIEDRGYHRPELWSPEGWAWRQADAVAAPLHWRREASGWVQRDYEADRPVDPAEPLCHVSWYEADAHARWAGGRLPTEAEWERAALGAPVDTAVANLGATTFRPLVPLAGGASRAGCRGMIGHVWEWTSSEFARYPGFRAHPYPEYAEVFFDRGYRVLRGGSWATQPHVASATFRNWDLPQRRQLFAGLRVAWDQEDA